MVLEKLKSRDKICKVLSDPIPSASQIVQDAKTISLVLHQDCVASRDCQPPHQGPVAPSSLVNLVSNISQQIDDYHPGSDVGPALHAARQVAYWSSVFISMVANSASTIPSTSSLATSPTTASTSISSSNLPPALPTPASTSIMRMVNFRSVMYRSNRSFNIPLQFPLQFPPYPGQNVVQMPHTWVHSGDQMSPPRGHFTGT